MQYNAKDVEKYILLGYTPRKKRSVEKNILQSGHWGCFWAIVIWVIFHIIAILGDYPMRVLPVNISIILLIPIVVLITIKLGKFGLDYSINKSHKSVSPYILLFSTIGAMIGMNFARTFLSNISYSTSMAILSVVIVFLVLMFVFAGCISYYRVYLIRRFCPYLKNRHL